MVQISEALRHSLSIVQIPKGGQGRQASPTNQKENDGGGAGGGDKWPHAIADYEIWKAFVSSPRREEL
jgi:hypothetical protein